MSRERRGGRAERRPDAGGRPKPVRVGAAPAEAPPEVANPTRRWVDPDGQPHLFEVVGRARTSAAAGSVDLLLLRVRALGDPAPELECLVPGRSLDAFSDDELLEHFRRARPVVPESERPRGFFEGTNRDRRRSS